MSEIDWDGTGLPPVGTVCQRNIARSAWCETSILAASSDGSHVAYQDKAGQLGWSRSPDDFRPIRTPEQIAAEEREKEILGIYRTICISRAQAEALYDAGYRKQGDQP